MEDYRAGAPGVSAPRGEPWTSAARPLGVSTSDGTRSAADRLPRAQAGAGGPAAQAALTSEVQQRGAWMALMRHGRGHCHENRGPGEGQGGAGGLGWMGRPGHLLLLLFLLPVATQGRNLHVLQKNMGEPCEDHRECQSRCCVTGSLNPQKFCTPQTVFLKCNSWRKPNGFSCLKPSECKSNCCIPTGPRKQKSCMAKTFFLQCVPWKKVRRPRRAVARGSAGGPVPAALCLQPPGSYCLDHSECRSHCCLRLTEISPLRCVPHSGILDLCLPLVSGLAWRATWGERPGRRLCVCQPSVEAAS
ncbi:Leucine-rich colipase-like protein 1 [Galemys pyrenaicus]|uniref:Leucine-rich colipase-like protein 1 n=1 Tax=Galemys pyrenaicus TaxID=202257 RepID=A0A8J6DQV6_GALPY|nr:Leucine-rich colipase-like protein 1 [Galemys pyrenaicus]